jgi:uncharacterized protein YndB with AHSA1/START domain
MTKGGSEMEYGTIERELYIEASPEIVFDVVSSPEHVREWWSDEAEFGPEPGQPGWVGFGDLTQDGKKVQLTVADAVPYTHFSFRWTHEEGEVAAEGNSNLVVFELVPSGGGTLLKFTESGFRERGWDEAKAAAVRSDHSSGWDHFLARLREYAPKVGAEA